MTYFTEDFLDFFKELAAHNHKDWFDENRKRYTRSVKEPFDRYIADVILEVRKLDPSVLIAAKDAIFRINRDIRFSANKEPYKLDRSAIVSSAGRKDHSVPGFYISLGPEKAMFGGGAYFMPAEILAKTRTAIAAHPEKFRALVKDTTFREHYGELKGDENKRLPKELREAAENEPLLYKKQLYYMAENDPEIILRDDLMDITLEHYRSGQPMQQFLADSMAP